MGMHVHCDNSTNCTEAGGCGFHRLYVEFIRVFFFRKWSLISLFYDSKCLISPQIEHCSASFHVYLVWMISSGLKNKPSCLCPHN